VDRHLSACTICAGQFSALQSLRAGLRASLPYHRAPPALAARIGAALARESAPPAKSVRPRWLAPLPAMGGGLAGALAGVALTLLVTGRAPVSPVGDLRDDLIDSHVRSMMAEHLTDVRTSDQHTVKPWLSARVDVSPPVRDLAPDGFPLIGGRLDYIDGHPAAAVVYKRREHVINLFAWAFAGPDQPPRASSARGFNVITWTQGGTRFAAVSDLNAKELTDFVERIAHPS
jgi:anti-sigma factor RsiW